MTARPEKTEATQVYREDLAYIHSLAFSEFAERSAPGLLEILRETGVVSGRVVDLGCGGGEWAGALCRAGYRVLGVDISSAMIRRARRKAPQARFMRASICAIELPPCNAVTIICGGFNQAFTEKPSKTRLRFFRAAYRALAPGGVLVFDVAEPGFAHAEGRGTTLCHGEDWCCIIRDEEDEERKVLTRRMLTFRKMGKYYRRSEEIHRVRLYESSLIANELRRAGFKVRVLRGYGAFRFPGAQSGFRARKP